MTLEDLQRHEEILSRALDALDRQFDTIELSGRRDAEAKKEVAEIRPRRKRLYEAWLRLKAAIDLETEPAPELPSEAEIEAAIEFSSQPSLLISRP